MIKALANLFLAIGFIFIIYTAYLFYQRNYSNKLSFKSAPEIIASSGKNLPKKLIIPSIEKELDIYSSEIRDNKWETVENGVSYLKSTPIPGEKGNSVIYGHNWNTILGSLNRVEPGDIIVIEYNNGEKKEYVIENTATVSPTQVSVIKNSDDSRITIFTCTGFLDGQRFVVVSKPINNSI